LIDSGSATLLRREGTLQPEAVTTVDRLSRQRHLLSLALLTLVYFAAGKLGLRLASINASASAVWPPTGIALAALLLLGARAWPAIFLGAFAVNVTTTGLVVSSLGIAMGNTLEAVLGAYLVSRFAADRRAFESGRDILRFSIAALFATTISASCGVTTLSLTGLASWEDYGSIWLTWWLGDAAGALIAAPLVLHWINHPRLRWSRRQVIEMAILAPVLIVVGLLVFDGLIPTSNKSYPLEYLCVPFLIWAAFRLGAREAATATALLSGIATFGTVRGLGPFARPSQNESLLLLQAFMAVISVTILTLAALVAERDRSEERLRLLSVTDALTGLSNYRDLVVVLEGEIRRSERTGRPFAVLLLDVDRLKAINDAFGHLAGSKALCRVADAIRKSCRAVDTAARYGGDEFAVVLTETEESSAVRVAHRIWRALTSDGHQPPVSVSFGVSMYPRDGKTSEALLGTADHALYDMKNRRAAPDFGA